MSNLSVRERYQDQAVAQSYDDVRFRGPIGRSIDALEKRAVAKALCRVRQEIAQPRTLDLPCGTGRITEQLLNEGLEVHGGDISVAMVEIAKERLAGWNGRVSFSLLDLENLDLPADSYDLVTCIRFFNHVPPPDRRKTLRELHRVTCQYAVINIAFSTAFYRAAAQLRRVAGIVMPKEPWTWKELEEEVANAGFRIKDYYFEMRFLSEVVVLLLQKVRSDCIPQ